MKCKCKTQSWMAISMLPWEVNFSHVKERPYYWILGSKYLYFQFESLHVMSHKSHWSMIDLLQDMLNCDTNEHPFNINLPY